MLKKKEVLAVFAVIIMLGIAFENVVFGASRNEKEENDANDAGENVLDVGLPIDNDETGGDINNGYMEDDGKLENIEKVTLVDDGEGSFERDKSTYDWPTFHHDMQRTGYTSGLGDIISPSIKWKYNDNTPYCNAPVIADINNDGNNEVIQTMSDFIRAFNGATGDLLWEFPVNSGNHDTPTVFDVDSDGEMEVIAGARDENTLYCIDGATGDEEWHFQVPLADPYYIQNSPAVGDVDNDGSVEIVFNVEFYGIFCVSGSDGTEKWNVSTGGGMTTWTSPAIYDSDADNYLEIFTNRGGTIYCLNGLDGAIQWHTSFRYHSSLICDPTIYDVDDDGDTEVIFGGLYNLDPPSSDEIGIFCLNAEDGQEEWRFVLGENLPNDDFLSPVIGDVDGDGYKEIICAGYWKYSGFNPVFCLDGKTGNEEWNYSAQPDAGWIHPAMCDIDGDGDIEVLIGNRLDGKLYCINANNGSLKWTYENIGEIQCSPVIGDVDNDGTVEIAITGGSDLYYLQNDFGPQPPVPVLNGPYRAGTGDTIHFNAADSWDPDGYIVGYRWDWTNDGIWDTEWLSTPTIDHIYKDPFNGTVAVEVKDDENLTSIGTESIQIDETPPIAWNKTWGSLGSDNGKSVQQTSDGGYILTGSFGSELCLIKTDTNGNEEWVRLYGGADLEEGKSVQQTSDGGYIVAGFTSSYGAGGCDFWLLKTDSSGNEEWNKTFGTADYFDSAYSVQQTNDGGYIITGSKYYGKAWLIKTDSYGDEEWNKILDDGCGYSVRQTIDGGYIIGGVFKEGDKYKAGLIKTDSDGNQQWKKTFSFSYGYSVWQTNDSGYIFTGGEYPAFLIKTDNNGNLEWNRTFELWFGQSVQQTADGGYIVSGNSGSSWNYKTFFIKTDRNGTMLWCRKIERSGGGGVAIQTTDKGYILLTNDAIHDKIWLIKFGWSPPTADTGGPYYGNPGYPVSFDGGNSHDNDENGQSIVRYDWKFFDGDTWHNDIGPMPTYTYMNVGNYTVTLRVWDDEGNNDTDATRVYINYLPHPPTANAGGPYHVMEDDVLILNASLSHDNDENGSRIVRYDWKFFDGDVWHNDNGSNPSYVYSDPGEYTVTVRVHDDEGITDEDTATVTVYGYYPPTADAGGTYYAMEEYGNEPDDPVHFDGSGSHDNDEHYFHNGTGYCIVNWTWNFGDGNIGYGKKVNHSYADEGTYTVTLIVTDNEGNTSNDTATAVIYGYYPPVAVPGGPYYGINSEPVQFDGSNSHDNDENGNSIVRYDWKFFDGDSWHNDTGVTPSHTYYIDGTYTVSLRVWDDEDPSSYNISNTTVTITHYNDPTADAGGPYTGKAYIPVTFDASASHDNDEGGCCITGYRWDWENDGVWDTGWLTTPTAQHTYLLGFTGDVRVQVKDDDGSHVGYDEDTAPVNIAGNPPTADFQIIKTNNPAIFKFDASSSIDPRPGCDYHYLNYKWDFNNDGIWDKTGNWYSAGIVTWRYSSSGQKTIKLMVSNPDGSDTTTKTVQAFNYNDIYIRCSNPRFFFGYRDVALPPMYNKYYFTTPKDVFDKVTFQIADYVVTDTNPTGGSEDKWEGLLKMNEGRHGDKVIIEGYKNDIVVWSTSVNTKIIDLPGWFITYLLLSEEVSVTQDWKYKSWKMTVKPGEQLGLSFPKTKVPLKFIGGKYKFAAKIEYLSDKFTIDDSGSFSIRLVKGTIPIKSIKLGDYSNFKLKGGFKFSATATLRISQDHVSLSGTLDLGGSMSVSFDIPVFGIPFLAEAGLTGGMNAGAGIKFKVGSIGSDGVTFCPDKAAIVYISLGGHAGVYGEILWGLGRLEGGLEASGKFELKIPVLLHRITLYGGVYAEASALWGAISHKWSYGLTYTSPWSRENSFGRTYLSSFVGNIKTCYIKNIDLPCLRDFDRNIKRLRGTTLLAGNVGESAVPKIVITENGKAIAVWSDINLVDNGSGIQSDIFWSVYDGSSWGIIESTNTSAKSEFDPELIVVNDNGEEYVILTYLVVDKTINGTTDVSTFYAEPRIHTAVWSDSKGWSFKGENLLIYGGTINSRNMYADDEGNIYMCYLKDTDCDPWENGIGTLFIVNGSIAEYDTGNEVNWSDPVLVKEFDDIDFPLQPYISFINSSVGGVVYPIKNISSNATEIHLLPTVSEITGFNNTDFIINVTSNSVSYVSSIVYNESIMVFWIENNSQICQCVIDTDTNLSRWGINPVEVVLSNISVFSLKPVSFDEKTFLLFQSSELFTPYVIERLPNGSWGKLRQISLDEKYSLAQIDGDSNGNMSQIIYVKDTPLNEWLIGRWRFNEGNGTNISDDSGNGNDGKIIGDTEWIEQTNETFDPIYGYGLKFNDTNSYVEIPYNSSLVVDNELTTTCWVNISNNSGEHMIIGINDSWIIYESNGNLGVKLWRIDGFINQSNITTLPLNTWTFISIIYNHGVLRVIVRPNGLNNTTAMYNLGDYSITDSGNPLIIGGFVGCMDEVWLFNHDISMSEVDSIWFTPYPTLGSIHDIIAQHLPSFASFNLTIGGRGNYTNITTEDIITFTGYPSGFIFEWDFGDGTYTSGQNVSHQYDTAGFYTIICNATDPSTGAVTPILHQIYVSDVTPPVFAGLQSIVNGSNNITLSWNPANDTSPFITYYGFLSNRSGVYNFSSPYFVTENTSYVVDDLEANKTYYFIVRAFDASGNSDDNTVELSGTPFDSTPPIFNGLTGVYKIDNYNRSVLLEWNDAVDISEPIIYNIYISTVSGIYNFSNPIGSTNLTWYIVDGLNESTYYFVVHAIDAYGNEDDNMVEMNISFNIPPFANFAFMPTYPTTMDTVTFIDLSIDIDGYIVNWTWNFGDGNISYQQNPSHQYANIGRYNVSLTVRDNDGATGNIIKQIIVVSIDYILITYKNRNELKDCNISTNFSFKAYASAFNSTYGFIGFINANWSILNYGTNATINATQGKSILFNSGWNDRTAILYAEYNEFNDTVVFTINLSLFSFILYKGWNLITLPCKNSYNASSLFNDIEGCSIILSWNASLQDFMLYAPGSPYDFAIEDGHGYFVGMNHDSIFSLVDSPIQSVNVTLYIGWNMLGWFKENETTASSLYNAIENCSIILSWNASLQNFELYVPGTPDFVIKQGDGFLVAVGEQSIWHGEG